MIMIRQFSLGKVFLGKVKTENIHPYRLVNRYPMRLRYEMPRLQYLLERACPFCINEDDCLRAGICIHLDS